jgi:hypothetical protein
MITCKIYMGRTFRVLDIQMDIDTIKSIKRIVESEIGLTVDKQYLIYNNIIRADILTLDEIPIKNGDTVFILPDHLRQS